MTIAPRQRSQSSLSQSSLPDRSGRRAPPAPLATLHASLSVPDEGGQLLPDSASPRSRAHTVADPQQLPYDRYGSHHLAMYQIPPPPRQPASAPAQHMGLPPPPPRPSTGMNLPPPPHNGGYGVGG